MKLGILMILCILISSCNLFKKVSKEKFEERQSYELEKVSGSKSELSDHSVSGSVISGTVKDKSVRSKFIKADKVVVRPDGSVEASGDVEFHGLDQLDIDSATRAENFKKSNIKYAAEAEEKLKAEAELKAKNSKSESNPSGKGLLIGSVSVLVVLIGVMWWFGIKRK